MSTQSVYVMTQEGPKGHTESGSGCRPYSDVISACPFSRSDECDNAFDNIAAEGKGVIITAM